MQSFGGPWTIIKLEVLDKYLSFYVTVMKNKDFKLCYIDAFAGSGDIKVKGVGQIPGSAIRALNYSFDQFIFIEKELAYAHKLEEAIKSKKTNKIRIEIGDCNELLRTIATVNWYEKYWRGVIFLDPYAMNLKWDSLRIIAQTKAFDVWYLFPLSALIRVLRRDGKIDIKSKEKITELLGTADWEKDIYFESPQLSLFGGAELERISLSSIKTYIIGRLSTVFPGVADNPLVLRNPQNNSPLFLLCFSVSNPNKKAIDLSVRAANHILSHTG